MDAPRSLAGYDDIADWLTQQTLADGSVEDILSGCCERLWAAGVPLHRVFVSLPTLHPLYVAKTYVWEPGADIRSEAHPAEGLNRPAWLKSPLAYLIRHGLAFLRRRLEGEGAPLDFPVLEDLKRDAFTDYAVMRIPMTSQAGNPAGTGGLRGVLASWSTKARGGFSDEHLAAVQRLLRTLAVACKVRITEEVTRNVLAAYLGRDAGLRVLKGAIKHGDGETIRAAIWYSDLRRSTPLAASLPRDAFIAALNVYFEATAGAVIAAGGDVLRFVGDAVLAIFPIGEGNGAAAACAQAAAAARAALQRLDASNQGRRERDQEPLQLGLGLHLGDVMFGNIGIPERLEFSVIGSAANEVARLESVTKSLGRPVVASRAFVDQLREPWDPLGPQTLRGVSERIEVFAMPGA
jgi:adenylate cyclase